MKTATIQTLHPQANKTNKKIALSKYSFIKENILNILTHIAALYSKNWFVTWVSKFLGGGLCTTDFCFRKGLFLMCSMS